MTVKLSAVTKTIGHGAAALLALLLVPGGCSSSSDREGPKPCAQTPEPPSDDAYCAALAAYDGRCGHCNDCAAQNLQHCVERGSALSEAHRAAYIACQSSASCRTDPMFDHCVEERMQSAVPTAAQLAAKAAYCDACGETRAADCANFFAIDPESGKNGAGYNVLLYNDEVVANAATFCARECDPFRYAVCIALAACGPAGGDFCDDGGLCVAH